MKYVDYGATAVLAVFLLAWSPAGADHVSLEVVATIPVGRTPIDVVVDPSTQRAYVANQGEDTVSIIDTASLMEVGVVPVGRAPRMVASNRYLQKVYALSSADGSVTVIDATTAEVVATVMVGESPTWLAVNPFTGRVYVSNFDDDTVTVIDGRTDAVIAEVDVAGGPWYATVNPLTNRVFVSCVSGRRLNVIDGDSNEVVDDVSVPRAHPRWLGINIVTNRVYVTFRLYPQDFVIEFDGDDLSVENVFRVGTPPNTFVGDITVNPVTNRIYVYTSGPVSGLPTINVIDGELGQLVTAFNTGSGHDLEVNPFNNRLYISAGRTRVIKAWSDGAPRYIWVGTPNNESIALDPSRDLIFGANHEEDSVSVVAGSHPEPWIPLEALRDLVAQQEAVDTESGGRLRRAWAILEGAKEPEDYGAAARLLASFTEEPAAVEILLALTR